jgi:polar amino acid transport system permease protein
MYEWNFEPVLRRPDLLVDGLLGTMKLSASAMSIAVPLGLILAIMCLSRSRILSGIGTGTVYVLRSAALLVLIYWFYFALPRFVGGISPFVAATLALGIQSSGYFAELFRGGINAVPRGQMEAAKALGLGRAQSMRSVILPQAVRRMLPVFLLTTIDLVKATSLAAVITFQDLTYQATRIAAETYRPLETFTVVAVIYFVLFAGASGLTRVVERRLAVSDR